MIVTDVLAFFMGDVFFDAVNADFKLQIVLFLQKVAI